MRGWDSSIKIQLEQSGKEAVAARDEVNTTSLDFNTAV